MFAGALDDLAASIGRHRFPRDDQGAVQGIAGRSFGQPNSIFVLPIGIANRGDCEFDLSDDGDLSAGPLRMAA